VVFGEETNGVACGREVLVMMGSVPALEERQMTLVAGEVGTVFWL